jgi:hypothetical protein
MTWTVKKMGRTTVVYTSGTVTTTAVDDLFDLGLDATQPVWPGGIDPAKPIHLKHAVVRNSNGRGRVQAILNFTGVAADNIVVGNTPGPGTWGLAGSYATMPIGLDLIFQQIARLRIQFNSAAIGDALHCLLVFEEVAS